MIKACKSCDTNFEIKEEDLQFYQKMSPTFNGKTFLIPPPTFCPECRMRRRTSWRNEYQYYPRMCLDCNKKIVSTFEKHPIYCTVCWWSDRWDAYSYARDYDFNRDFLDQYMELYQEVPQAAMMNDNGISSENSEYCQDISYAKNCYLVTGSWNMQDVMYSSNCSYCRDIIDCDSLNLGTELCYQCADSQHLYDCNFLFLSANCNSCSFAYDLKNCADCICCYGLRQKSHCIFNKQYSKEEYLEKKKEFSIASFENLKKIKKEFFEFIEKFPRKALHQVNCEDCTGDNLFGCKNVLGFDLYNAEHCRYVYKGDSPINCYDLHQTGKPQWCYECITPDDGYMQAFTTWCWRGSKNVYYSDNCHNCEHVFGCVGLRHAEYCILNKQYSKKDYENILEKIIEKLMLNGQWGEFFPENMSPIAYNETLAYEYFPLSKEEVLKKGLRWKEKDRKEFVPQSYLTEDNIANVADDILNNTLACVECERNYRIAQKELQFYRKGKIAIPRKCHHCRRKERWSKRNPYKLFPRNCAACNKDILTPHAKEKVKKVLCEECYLKEIY